MASKSQQGPEDKKRNLKWERDIKTVTDINSQAPLHFVRWICFSLTPAESCERLLHFQHSSLDIYKSQAIDSYTVNNSWIWLYTWLKLTVTGDRFIEPNQMFLQWHDSVVGSNKLWTQDFLKINTGIHSGDASHYKHCFNLSLNLPSHGVQQGAEAISWIGNWII